MKKQIGLLLAIFVFSFATSGQSIAWEDNINNIDNKEYLVETIVNNNIPYVDIVVSGTTIECFGTCRVLQIAFLIRYFETLQVETKHWLAMHYYLYESFSFDYGLKSKSEFEKILQTFKK